MLTLKGKSVCLRALEPSDLSFLEAVENNEEFWDLSHTQTPFSKYTLQQYINNASQDIYEAKQLRLMISDLDHSRLGLIDVFDFDPKNRRAGIGILVNEHKNRRHGYAFEALQLMLNYGRQRLLLHQVYANISANNMASKSLFEKLGFELIGVKKEWNFFQGAFEDELLYQYIYR